MTPVRMYLREIGRVTLLTARDERVLARAMELQRRLDLIQETLEEQEGAKPTACGITNYVLVTLLPQHKVVEAIGKFLGLPPDMRLSTLLINPDLRELIDGPHNEELLNLPVRHFRLRGHGRSADGRGVVDRLCTGAA